MVSNYLGPYPRLYPGFMPERAQYQPRMPNSRFAKDIEKKDTQKWDQNDNQKKNGF